VDMRAALSRIRNLPFDKDVEYVEQVGRWGGDGIRYVNDATTMTIIMRGIARRFLERLVRIFEYRIAWMIMRQVNA
jgi:hypothetical protein